MRKRTISKALGLWCFLSETDSGESRHGGLGHIFGVVLDPSRNIALRGGYMDLRACVSQSLVFKSVQLPSAPSLFVSNYPRVSKNGLKRTNRYVMPPY